MPSIVGISSWYGPSSHKTACGETYTSTNGLKTVAYPNLKGHAVGSSDPCGNSCVGGFTQLGCGNTITVTNLCNTAKSAKFPVYDRMGNRYVCCDSKCPCCDKNNTPKYRICDLTKNAFSVLAPLTQGLIAVELSW